MNSHDTVTLLRLWLNGTASPPPQRLVLGHTRTKKAMDGGVSFRDALVARLNIIKPSAQQVESFLQQNPPALTPGVKYFTVRKETSNSNWMT